MMPGICPLTAGMSAVAAALHEAAGFHEIWDEKAFADLLAMPGTAGCLALDADEPVGLVLWRAVADEAEILTICILPERRRTGLGRVLLAAATAEISKAGARRLLLEVAIDNDAAIALYGGSGFVRAGLRKAYYRRPAGAVDALILAKDI